MVGHALYPDLVAQYAGYVGEPTEVIIPHLILNAVHPMIGILLIATMAAIVVSTADSFLLTPATNLVNDVWKRFFDKNLSGAREVLILRFRGSRSRYLGLFLGYAVHTDSRGGVIRIYDVRRSNKHRRCWLRSSGNGQRQPLESRRIATGMLMTILWQSVIQGGLDAESWGAMDAVIPAMVASVAVLVGVSFATPAPDRAKWEPFFRTDSTSS